MTDHVVVTGGAGFIGHHLVHRLVHADTETTVIDDLSTGRQARLPDGTNFIEGDVRDPATVADAVDDADTIYHLAALVSVPESITHPQRSRQINLDGTMNVLEAARATETRVIFASSAAIYGHPRSLPVDEDQPTTPTAPYGIDKLAGDHYVRGYHDLYGIDTVALRYFNVYGPGQTGGDYAGVITTFIRQALANEPITVHGDGEQTRDFVFVDDVIDATIAAGETDHVGEAFNVATGSPTSIRELAETVQRLTDTDSDIVHTEPREGDIEHSVADTSMAKDALRFEPEVTLDEGLAETIAWYQRRTGEQ